MSYLSKTPDVGNILVAEMNILPRVWVVTKIWKGGDRATVRTQLVDGNTADGWPAETRQVTRGRFGSWRLGGRTVLFGDEPAKNDGPRDGQTVTVDDGTHFTTWTAGLSMTHGTSLIRTVGDKRYSAVLTRSADGTWNLNGRPATWS